MVIRVIARRVLPGLLTAPLRAVAAGTRMAVTATALTTGAAASTALLGGTVVANFGNSLARAAPDVSALAHAAAGIAVEAIGGPPARRAAANGQRYWIEVRGLKGAHDSEISTNILAAVRSTPGVQDVFLNRSVARVVVTVGADGPPLAELCRIVADAERQTAGRLRRQPTSLPGDDAVLMGRMIAAAAAVTGLGISVTGSALRLRGLPDVFSAPTTMTDYIPRLRRQLEQRLGPEGTDLLFGVINAATASLTISPTAAAAEAVTRAMLAAEAWNGRLAWR